MWDAFILVDALLPTGGFALSHGLETLVQTGQVINARDLENVLWTYACQIRASEIPIYRALRSAHDSLEALQKTQLYLDAWVMPQETRQANQWQAHRLLKIVESTFAMPVYPRPLYGVQAWALVAGHLTMDVELAETAYIYKQLSEMTSAAMRLMRCDSVESAAALWRIRDRLQQYSEWCPTSELEMASISPWLDIVQMQHEKQDSRLFRT